LLQTDISINNTCKGSFLPERRVDVSLSERLFTLPQIDRLVKFMHAAFCTKAAHCHCNRMITIVVCNNNSVLCQCSNWCASCHIIEL